MRGDMIAGLANSRNADSSSLLADAVALPGATKKRLSAPGLGQVIRGNGEPSKGKLGINRREGERIA
jgi:hypothetical protein